MPNCYDDFGLPPFRPVAPPPMRFWPGLPLGCIIFLLPTSLLCSTFFLCPLARSVGRQQTPLLCLPPPLLSHLFFYTLPRFPYLAPHSYGNMASSSRPPVLFITCSFRVAGTVVSVVPFSRVTPSSFSPMNVSPFYHGCRSSCVALPPPQPTDPISPPCCEF